MPEPILHSQAPVTARPQTSRAVRRAFNKRRPTGPSKKDLERFAREEKNERLAEAKRKREKNKKENERKRAEEREKLKEKIKQCGVEEVVKVAEGQMRIAGFFKTGAKEKARLGGSRDTSQGRPSDLQKEAVEKTRDGVEKQLTAVLESHGSIASQTSTLRGDSIQDTGDTKTLIDAPTEQRQLLQNDSHISVRSDMPPPSQKPRQRTTSSAQKANGSTKSQDDTTEALARKPLGSLSANVQPLPTTSMPLKKRKAPSSELEEDWADFFQSNTQLEVELFGLADGRPNKRQRSMEAPTSTFNIHPKQLRRAMTESYVENVVKPKIQHITARAPRLSPRGGPQQVQAAEGTSSRDGSLGHLSAQSLHQHDALPPPKTKPAVESNKDALEITSRLSEGHHHFENEGQSLAQQIEPRLPLNARAIVHSRIDQPPGKVSPSLSDFPKSQTAPLEQGSDDFLEGLSSQEFINIPTSPLRAPQSPVIGQESPAVQREQKHKQKQEGIAPAPPKMKERQELPDSVSTPFDGLDWGIPSQDLLELVP
ncbi:hypothetical protein MMC10_009200 [Thelotrema lepadinum]|nr:hypothetical protein [Thelotrema lepadinum]